MVKGDPLRDAQLLLFGIATPTFKHGGFLTQMSVEVASVFILGFAFQEGIN